MTLEEIKSDFCKKEDFVEELRLQYEQYKKLLKEKSEKIPNLEEYKQYINDTKSEEKRLKLIETPTYKEFLKLKLELDEIEKRLKVEQTKCTEEEFEKIEKQAKCTHVFYRKSDNQKICIKCGYTTNFEENTEQKDTEIRKIEKFLKTMLYSQLRSHYESDDKKCIDVTDIIQREDLEYINNLVLRIIRKYPNIDDIMLINKIEQEIAEQALEFIEGLKINNIEMSEEARENYEEYKKIARKK